VYQIFFNALLSFFDAIFASFDDFNITERSTFVFINLLQTEEQALEQLNLNEI